MRLRVTIFLVLIVLWSAGWVWGGGSGLNVIVVVNQHSTNSVQLGNDYCEQRGVPPQNVLRLTNWSGSSIEWSPGDFKAQLLNPLLDMVASRGLTNQAQFVLLSMDLPYRVTDGTGQNSTTSALFYGFKTNGEPVSGIPSCSLPDASFNSYAFSELPLSQATPSSATTNSFLAMMLTDTNLAGAESILRRAVASDSSFPTQTVYLAKTSDAARNVRFVEFDNAIFENQVRGNYAVTRTNTDDTLFTNLFGLQTGRASFSLATNAFVPGGISDSLTSFGGDILESTGQTPLLALLEAGAAGSYGTVVEPCNYPNKFPDPRDYFYQTRGFSVAEAYYQSVQNPFEGLLVGEPLAAPFANPGSADWISLTNGSGLSGQTNLILDFTAATNNLPLAQADLFVDGTFFQTMTNLPPAAGNVLSVTLNGFTTNYTVPANATLATVATSLAAALNNITNVQALPKGDRIQLQSLDVSVPGSNVTVSASAAVGSATILTTRLTAARPVFMDSAATGQQLIQFFGTPTNGDWLQLTCIKTNGDMITLGVTNNTTSTTIGALAQSLVTLINSTPALESADGLFASDFIYDGATEVQFSLYARTPGWLASQILFMPNSSTNLDTSPISTSPLQYNLSDLRPRNHLYLSSGTTNLAVNFALNTTNLPDGWHELTAVAYEGTSVATQTRVTRTVLIQNTGLTATFTTWPSGSTNATLNQQLQFTVTANTNNISSIELFSTGGSVGVATGQATNTFTLAATNLGLGLHPFYALVTDEAGHRYRTRTAWYRIIQGVVAPNLAYTVAPGISQRITLAEIETNELHSSLASPNFALTGVSATSQQGGTVIFDANNIQYTYPAAGSPATDSFSYTVTDGVNSAMATVTLTFQPQSGAASGSLTVTNGTVTVTLFGIPGVQYDVQRSTDLSHWTTLLAAPPLNVSPPITAGLDGRISFTDNFSDLGTAPSAAYYRTIQH